ncbi:hypothetical protein [Streptomyces sp. NBC_01602]
MSSEQHPVGRRSAKSYAASASAGSGVRKRAGVSTSGSAPDNSG